MKDKAMIMTMTTTTSLTQINAFLSELDADKEERLRQMLKESGLNLI